MAHTVTPMPLQVHHGHSETHVVTLFTRPVSDLSFTPAEAEDFIKAMQASLAALAAKQAAKK
jgi:hypothetical protein